MLMIAVFALQSYVTQTHIHFEGQVVTGGFTFPDEGSKALSGKPLSVTGNHGDQDKIPPKDDPANCPICQEILHFGSYVVPMPIAALLAALMVPIVASIDSERPFVSVISHNWRGRAPPSI
jgi:hypothetical protein